MAKSLNVALNKTHKTGIAAQTARMAQTSCSCVILQSTPKPPVRKGPIVTITNHMVMFSRETIGPDEPKIRIVQDLCGEA